MDLKIIVFCIFLHYNKSFCLENSVTGIINQYYTVTTDQRHTDKETVSYTQNIYKNRKERIREVFRFLRHEHVCKTRPEVRTSICEDLLEVYKNGFKLGSSVASFKCKKKIYTIQLLTLAKSTESNLYIYDCPPVFYTDLETGQQITLPYTYKVSNARTYNSAILFVQKDADSNVLYPQKYVRNIDFKQMRTPTKIVSSLLAKTEQAESNHDGFADDSTRKTYLQQKLYTRFVITHKSIEICHLTIVHRTLLCNVALKDLKPHGEKDPFAPHPSITCSRRKVTLTALEADDYETNRFTMSPCYHPELRLQDLYFVGKNQESHTRRKDILLSACSNYQN